MGLRRNVTAGIALVLLLSFVSKFSQFRTPTFDASKTTPHPSVDLVRYPSGIPHKFDSQGNIQPFRGNTIIAFLYRFSQARFHQQLVDLYVKLDASHMNNYLYVLLPPSTWHVTFFEGVYDKIREPGRWPDDLSIDATMQECNSLYTNKLSSFDLQTDPPYHFTFTNFATLNRSGISLHLEPSAEDNVKLRSLRDRLSTLLHIRAKDHDKYEFHLTLAYMLRYLTAEQQQELENLLASSLQAIPKELKLHAPEFCTFEDITTFRQVLHLRTPPAL
ncbi:DUF1868-domain-containing protein [Favolaschia claudopus]|uniref:DUF1868-domain-containing protein n=1 Tax=Favolaschia claudopus TaxID=2862362 RepID=A0AAW0D6G3_9AGAR